MIVVNSTRDGVSYTQSKSGERGSSNAKNKLLIKFVVWCNFGINRIQQTTINLLFLWPSNYNHDMPNKIEGNHDGIMMHKEGRGRNQNIVLWYAVI